MNYLFLDLFVVLIEQFPVSVPEMKYLIESDCRSALWECDNIALEVYVKYKNSYSNK